MICNCLRWSEAVCVDTSQKYENILVAASAMVDGAWCGRDRKSWIWFYFPDLCDTAPWSVTCRRHTCFSQKSLSFFVSSSRTWGKSVLGVIFAPKSSRTNLLCLRYIFLWCRAFCDTSHVESFRSCRKPLQITWNLALKTFLSYSTMYQKVTVCYTRRAILLLLSVLVASNSILGSLASTAARTSL